MAETMNEPRNTSFTGWRAALNRPAADPAPDAPGIALEIAAKRLDDRRLPSWTPARILAEWYDPATGHPRPGTPLVELPACEGSRASVFRVDPGHKEFRQLVPAEGRPHE